jgi:hypothetical protein
MGDIFTIPAWRMGDMRRRLDALARKAAKLGTPMPSLTVLGERAEKRGDRLVAVCDVVVSGEPPQLAGWRFHAQIRHAFAGEGRNVVHAPHGAATLPDWWDLPGSCQHCRTLRQRSETYIVSDGDGVLKQVGSTCLRDFLGGTDPAAVAAWFEALAGLRAELREEVLDWGPACYTPHHVVALALATVREYGWVSKGNAGPGQTATASRVSTALLDRYGEGPSDEDRDAAEAALAWLTAQRERIDAEGSSFERNLLAAATRHGVELADVPTVCALVPTWHRAQRAAAPVAPSRWMASVGEKIEAIATLTGKRRVECYDGTVLTAYEWRAGEAVLTWLTGVRLDAAIGSTCTVRGRVKHCSEFRGVKQTELTRCAVS